MRCVASTSFVAQCRTVDWYWQMKNEADRNFRESINYLPLNITDMQAITEKNVRMAAYSFQLKREVLR